VWLLIACASLHGLASDIYRHSNYIPPPDLVTSGFSFADQRVPLRRKSVSDRVVEQLNYLLMDRRAGVMDWFDRLAEYGPMLRAVLRREGAPEDFVYLAAVLSDLTPTAQSKTGGLGWWSLGSVKEPSVPAACKWSSSAGWDDRRDPEASTRIAAARFVWLKSKLGSPDWLVAASAFIDGSEAVAPCLRNATEAPFWDLTLPLRAEILVVRSIALKIADERREAYGINVAKREPLSCDLVDGLRLKKEFPLRHAASWLRSTGRAIWGLNPGVDPVTGVLGKSDRGDGRGPFLRVPKGMGPKTHKLLVREGYIDG
jgi:membrane-bound lytic murein transglycosylase D